MKFANILAIAALMSATNAVEVQSGLPRPVTGSRTRPHHQLPRELHHLDISVPTRTMSLTTSSTTTPSQSPTLLDSQLDTRSSIRMDARRLAPRSSSSPSRSLRPRWSPTWVNSSQEPGPNSTLTTPARSTSPSPTPSCDPFSVDSTNSSSPQDPSPTLRCEMSSINKNTIKKVSYE